MTNLKLEALKATQILAPGGATYGAIEAFDHGHLFLGNVLTLLVATWVMGQVIAWAVIAKADLRRLFRA